MRTLFARVLFVLFTTVACGVQAASEAGRVRFIGPRGERDKGLMGRYDTASASDGKLRLRALWERSFPAREILSERGEFSLSEKKGWTYEFYVLVENVGKEDVDVPSITDRTPRSAGMSIAGSVIVPYIVRFYDRGGITFVESASAFRPVRLRPGESMRLPVYYRIGETLEPHWFFYAVDESVAKRYGWWSGALKCEAEQFLPNQASEPMPLSRHGSP